MQQGNLSSQQALAQAVRFHQAGRLKEAEVLLREILSESPGFAPALHGLAILLGERGELPQAIVFAEDAISIDSANAQYYRTLANLALRDQDLGRALEAFRTSLYLEPLNHDALMKMAETCEKQGDLYQAICYYQQSLETSSYQPGQTHALLARCLYRAGFQVEAIRHYEQAYNRLPYSADVLYEYARALLYAGDHLVCTTIMEHALQHYPKSARLLHIQGILLFRQDRFDEALAAFEQALLHTPDERQTLVDYAVCLRTIGDDRSAEQVLQKVSLLRS